MRYHVFYVIYNVSKLKINLTDKNIEYGIKLMNFMIKFFLVLKLLFFSFLTEKPQVRRKKYFNWKM